MNTAHTHTHTENCTMNNKKAVEVGRHGDSHHHPGVGGKKTNMNLMPTWAKVSQKKIRSIQAYHYFAHRIQTFYIISTYLLLMQKTLNALCFEQSWEPAA